MADTYYYGLLCSAWAKLVEYECDIEERDDTISVLTQENTALKGALADRHDAAMVRIARAIVKYADDLIVPEHDARWILGRSVDVELTIPKRNDANGQWFTSLNALVALYHERNVKHFQRARRKQKECVRLQQFADRQAKFERRAWGRLAAILARK